MEGKALKEPPQGKARAQIITFDFPVGSFWFISCFVLLVTIAFFVHGQYFHKQGSIIFSALCLVYLLIKVFITPKPPKSITVDFIGGDVLIENRWPQGREIIRLAELDRVEGIVRPRRYAVTELIFYYQTGVSKTLYFDVETAGSFMSLPKEIPLKQVQDFVSVLNQYLHN